jgi:hypothetical protein
LEQLKFEIDIVLIEEHLNTLDLDELIGEYRRLVRLTHLGCVCFPNNKFLDVNGDTNFNGKEGAIEFLKRITTLNIVTREFITKKYTNVDLGSLKSLFSLS